MKEENLIFRGNQWLKGTFEGYIIGFLLIFILLFLLIKLLQHMNG